MAACGSEESSTFGAGGAETDAAGGAPPGPFGGGDTPPVAPDGGAGNSTCKRLTCADQAIECGPAGDGCGGIIAQCGTCAAGLRCGGPNALSKCVSPTIGTACVPKTCADLGVECGLAGDGCGGVLTCPSCAPGMQCGATGQPSKCVAATPTSIDGGACVPLTCADYKLQGKDCGTQPNGCGGTVDCLGCVPPEFCGGGGPSKCAVAGGGACVPKTCAAYVGKCGPQPDGCGGVTSNCGTCTVPQVCGGGGVPNVCGGGVVGATDGGAACVPKATCGLSECGKVADGCGGVIDCGNSCAAGTICGGGGAPNTCGIPPCVPVAACPAQMNCGSIADGCGGVVQCGAGAGCTLPQSCGAGGQPNVCGGGGVGVDGGAACTPMTCAQTGKECGPVADGCGGLVDCPTCVSPAVCGGGGVASVCGGANQCTPRTPADCAGLGFDCGFIADGCGGLVQCGASCAGGGVCGGTSPNKCGSGGGTCTGFCVNQDKNCAANSKTRVTGTIFAPNATLPIPGALVYVPSGSTTPPYGVAPVTSGVVGGTCEQCGLTVLPLVSTTSASDGSFTLNDVPAGVSFPIIIQLGKWRRMVMIPAVTACTSQTLTAQQTRLATRQNEGLNSVDNIPLIAISTGSVDGLECVLWKLGIETAQFSNPTGYGASTNGRIRLYHDDDVSPAAGGAVIDGTTPSADTALTDTQAHLDQYDATVFGCAGGRRDRDAARLDRVRAYADKGGRVFATHFEYVYLYNRAPWDATVKWDVPNARSTNGSWTGLIDTGSTKRLLFSQWLDAPGVKALSGTSPPRISIAEPRNNADEPVTAPGAEEWISRYQDNQVAPQGNAVLHYTFNTPWGAAPANQCGRVLFSDFHVSTGNTAGTTFPAECLPPSTCVGGKNNGKNCTSAANCSGGGTCVTPPAAPLTAQEKVLAFFLFDLTSCIETPAPPTACTPKTCGDFPAGTCGIQSDGCGGTTANCLTCTNGQTCGGGGVPNQCGGPTCTPKTCVQQGADCGTVPDGCGGTVDCPLCAPGQTCGGGGVAYKCGTSSCAPRTCAEQGIACGQTGDGCGNVLTCPPCAAGTTCGGGGVANQCGAPTCAPIAACPPGKNCGVMPDGCGGSIPCGLCPDGETCGGGGAPNVCGAASCSPKTCVQLGAQCGSVSDGCGDVAVCPPCGVGAFCNGSNLCVSQTCTPKSCGQLGVQCGPAADGCGGLVQCGGCPDGQGCGAGGVPGVCGTLPCTPRTCSDLGALCGQVADGCGALTPDCGTCKSYESCKNGTCTVACVPLTCAQAKAQCGPVADGCGALVDCGPCAPGETCGYNNIPNVCGSDAPR